MTTESDWNPIRMSVCGRTDPGAVRSENQDRFLAASLDSDHNPPMVFLEGGEGVATQHPGVEFLLGYKGFLLMVADGMGGVAGGALASSIATREVLREVTERWLTDDDDADPGRFASVLRSAVEATNHVIQKRGILEPDFERMGTTATVVGVLDQSLYVAQVGDSRAYLLRTGTLHQITRDQSVAQEWVESGRMTADEADTAPGSNLILQALGAQPTVTVDLTFQGLRQGDVLLVCSDGLTRELRKHEIEALLVEAPDPTTACDRLLSAALDRDARDNVTVVVATFDGDALAEPGEGDFVGRTPWGG